MSDAGFAVTTCAILAAYNNVLGRQPWHDRWYVPLNACAAGAALSAAAASGLTAADLGLGRGAGRLRGPGSRWAGAAAAGWLLVAALPATRPVLTDKRVAGLTGRDVFYQAAVRIPVGTVLWEEIAFRGVLQAALRRVMPKNAAIAVTSGVFGIWHVRPTLQALRANGLSDNRRRAVAGVGAGVAATTAGGLLLSWLRERSGGLAAPMALHLVTNSGGAVAAWASRSRSCRRSPNLTTV
ncbi:MAG: CPBP family intramembrane metalloprotease [Nocardiopsaceae bacterium]|jgi:membrane protease YdiL (CAAX protease family)|nr:CPBP family intramembrane metalloprotease [Nocardiopsaceae bacterium]